MDEDQIGSISIADFATNLTTLSFKMAAQEPDSAFLADIRKLAVDARALAVTIANTVDAYIAAEQRKK